MFLSIIIYAFAFSFFFFLARSNAGGYTMTSENTVAIRDKRFLSGRTVLLLACFTLFCGARYDVGADYLEYLSVYLNYDQLGDYISGQYEYGFTYIFDLCNRLHLSPPVFFGFVAFLQMLFFLYAFRNERFLWPWILLFFFVDDGFLLWMNGIRQCLALCVWIMSLKSCENQKPLRYILICLGASLFHSSALLLIVLYPLLKKGKPYFNDMYLQYVILIAAFVIRIAFSSILVSIVVRFSDSSGMYANYVEGINDYGAHSNTNIAYWFRLIVSCIVIFYSEGMRTFYNSKRFNIIYTLFFIGVITRCIIPFDLVILTRITMYFTFFECIMLAFFVYYLSKTHEKYNKLIRTGIIISFIAIFFLNQIVSNENSSVWYQFYFNQPIIQSID